MSTRTTTISKQLPPAIPSFSDPGELEKTWKKQAAKYSSIRKNNDINNNNNGGKQLFIKQTDIGDTTPYYPVGTKLRKFWKGFGWFIGTVQRIRFVYIYKIVFSDGDSEELTDFDMSKGLRDGMKWLRGNAAAAAAAAGKGKTGKGTDICPGLGDELDDDEEQEAKEGGEEYDDDSVIDCGPQFNIGTKVKKYFAGHGWFNGEVASYRIAVLYQVAFDDGEDQEFTDEEMDKVVENYKKKFGDTQNKVTKQELLLQRPQSELEHQGNQHTVESDDENIKNNSNHHPTKKNQQQPANSRKEKIMIPKPHHSKMRDLSANHDYASTARDVADEEEEQNLLEESDHDGRNGNHHQPAEDATGGTRKRMRNSQKTKRSNSKSKKVSRNDVDHECDDNGNGEDDSEYDYNSDESNVDDDDEVDDEPAHRVKRLKQRSRSGSGSFRGRKNNSNGEREEEYDGTGYLKGDASSDENESDHDSKDTNPQQAYLKRKQRNEKNNLRTKGPWGK